MIFTRTGVPATVLRGRYQDASWRAWAFEQAGTVPDRDLDGVTLTFAPTCRGKPPSALSIYPTAEFVIDGLIAAGMFRSRLAVATVILHAVVPTGTDGMTVTIDAP